jgi:hypothetical protein
MNEISEMYIDLLKKVLTDYIRIEKGEYKPVYSNNPNWRTKIVLELDKQLRKKNYIICKEVLANPQNRMYGTDWPTYADTMIGIKRLENIQYCVTEVIKNNVEGDLIETGVWRGGATIFMRALLKAAGDKNRTVWVADSFEGLPKPNEELYPADKGDVHYKLSEVNASLEDVKANFEKYGLLDDQVKFLKGWFKDTLPTAPFTKLAVARLDGDMYESTMDGLVNLYPKLSKGGFLIVDDWGAVPACQQAVKDYRKKNNINEPIVPIDLMGVYWQKLS